MINKISTLARADFWAMANQAQEQGKDLAEVLDRTGVLLTPGRKEQIEADAIDYLAELIETTSPSQWLPNRTTRAAPTLYDLQNGIAEILRGMAQAKRQH